MAYETPGVYVEEISGGPRPVAASPTGDTAFVGVLALPAGFHVGGNNGYKSLIPTAVSTDASASWARELAFRSVVPGALAAPATLTVDGAAKSESDIATTLGGLDKKKKEVFKIGDTEYADAKAVVAALNKSASGDVVVEKAGGDKPASFTVGVQQAADIAPSLDELIGSTLGAGWTTSATSGGDTVRVLVSNGERSFDVDIPGTLIVDGGAGGWALAKPSMKDKVLSTLASAAVASGVGVSAGFPGKETEFGGDVLRSVQEALLTMTSPLSSLDAFLSWQKEFGDALYIELAHNFTGVPKASIAASWRSPKAANLRDAWQRWLVANPGMVRLDLSVRGFFTNGGAMAYPAFYLSAAGASAMAKGEFLGHAYDDFSRVAMVCSPGLSKDWQAAVLTYCGPKGRGDLFAVLDTPRYFLTQPSNAAARSRVGSLRWSDSYKTGDDPNFEVQSLEAIGAPSVSELRFRAMTDTLLSEVVPRDEPGHGGAYAPWVVTENPAATGLSDRYVVAPPSGFVAGLIAATDNKAGAGVHKAPANEQLAGVNGLVALIGDKDQGALNVRGINIIRPRPNAGIRVWGARTVASDPLWKYINVRRLFLMVERSLKSAIEWAVFLPNTDTTRGDLRSTIAGFLFSLWREGMLDGATTDEAYSVRCDRENNPDVDVRNGILTVDIDLRPPFPAEFIRLRFRQAPMQIDG